MGTKDFSWSRAGLLQQMAEANEKGRQCPTTHWTQIYLASQPEQESGYRMLGALLQKYLQVLVCHVRGRFGVGPDQAADWVQGFIEQRIMEKRLLALAKPSRGRFRTFLFSALDNFVRDQLHRDTAQKRGGRQALTSLEDLKDEEMPVAMYRGADPGDVAWARNVVEQALEAMKAECGRKGRRDLWSIFEGRVLQPMLRDEPMVPYDVLVRDCGFRSPAEASNALVTAKRMFGRMLREVVREYATGNNDLLVELGELQSILGASVPGVEVVRQEGVRRLERLQP